MADEIDKKKMANAKRSNTREVNAGKREATPSSKQAPDRRFMPRGILTDPTTGSGQIFFNNRTGEVYGRDRMEKRGPTSRIDAAVGRGHQIVTPGDLARASREERLPAAQKQMGRRAAGYKAGPEVKIGKPSLDPQKPYSRERSGEVADPKTGRIKTPLGEVTQRQVANQGTRGRAALRKIDQAGARPTDKFRQELAQRRKAGADKVELANSKAVTARQAAQAKYGRDVMQARRDAVAKQAADAAKRRAQAPARAKAAVNNAVGAVKAGARKSVMPFGLGTIVGAGAMNERRKRDVNSAGMNGFNAGKVAGRQTTSTGAKAPIARPKGSSRGR